MFSPIAVPNDMLHATKHGVSRDDYYTVPLMLPVPFTTPRGFNTAGVRHTPHIEEQEEATTHLSFFAKSSSTSSSSQPASQSESPEAPFWSASAMVDPLPAVNCQLS